MTRKVLICASVDAHIASFHLPYLQLFYENGWEVHVAARGGESMPYTHKKVDWRIARSPFARGNLAGYRQIKRLLAQERYDVIHVHTPNAAALLRLAARKTRRLNQTKVFYTAHGFHFYRGAPWKRWLLYYPVEKWLSRYTDTLLLVNREDYHTAQERRFAAANIRHCISPGVDAGRFCPADPQRRRELRKAFHMAEDEVAYIYAANFEPEKNHGFLLDVFAKVCAQRDKARLYLLGRGALQASLQAQCRALGVEDRVFFPGYSAEMEKWLQACDVCVSTSRREGIGLGVIEGLLCHCPVVISDIRGHRDTLDDGRCGLGFLAPLDDEDAWVEALLAAEQKSCQNARDELERFTHDAALARFCQVYEETAGICICEEKQSRMNEMTAQEGGMAP